jgi:hypothetical protein
MTHNKIGYSLPEIEITRRQLTAILKIVLLTSIFAVVVVQVLSAHAATKEIEEEEGQPNPLAELKTLEEKYQFVYCFNEVMNSTFTYPTGTSCELIDDNLEEDEEREDEKEHERESRRD